MKQGTISSSSSVNTTLTSTIISYINTVFINDRTCHEGKAIDIWFTGSVVNASISFFLVNDIFQQQHHHALTLYTVIFTIFNTILTN
jgi:hypothetical protein